MMDWTQIILAILGLLGTIDLGRIVFFRASKKKANAEAVGVEKTNESTAVETLEKAIDQMSESNDRYAELLKALRQEADEYHNAITRKDDTIATLLMLICKHRGCAVREPIPGQGRIWYENNKEDIALGMDDTPINQLLVQYGERKKRVKSDAGVESE